MSETVKIHKLLDSDGALFSPYVVKDSVFNADGTPYFLQDTQTTPHASQHAAGGADPITPNMIGAASNPTLLDNSRWDNIDNIIDQRGGYVVPPNEAVWSNDSVIGYTDRYYKVESFDGTNNAVITFNNTAACTVDGTKAVRGYAGAGYTIDRWKGAPNTHLLILDDSVRLGGEWHISQFFERAINGVVTLSVLFKNHSGVPLKLVTNNYEGTAETQVAATSETEGLLTATFTAENVEEVLIGFRESGSSDNTADIIAIKLELGTQQTLAHQDENGNWVLNDPPPNKQQELAKCQRYQVIGKMWGNMIIDYRAGGLGVGFHVPLSVPLRNTPSVVNVSGFSVRSSTATADSTREATLFGSPTLLNNGLYLYFYPVSADTSESLRLEIANESGFDANL